MISLMREPWYRFDFDSFRKVDRVHLEGALEGSSVRICRSQDGIPGITVLKGKVGLNGWAQLEEALITRPGDRYLAVVERETGRETGVN